VIDRGAMEHVFYTVFPRPRRDPGPLMARPSSSGPVDIAAVIDAADYEQMLRLVDAEHNPVLTSPRDPETGELVLERLAHSPRISSNRAVEPLERGGHDLPRQAGELALRLRSEGDIIWLLPRGTRRRH
jgi:hypothetical protein